MELILFGVTWVHARFKQRYIFVIKAFIAFVET